MKKNYLKTFSNFLVHKSKNVFFAWLVLIFSAILVIIFHPNNNLETEISGNKQGEAFEVKTLLNDDFNLKLGNSSALVLEGKPDTTKLKTELKKTFPQIKLISDFTNDEHKNTLLILQFDKEVAGTEVQKLTPEIRKYLKTSGEKALKSYYTGPPAFQYDAKVATQNDSKTSELFALLVSFIILVFTFGSLVSAIIPVIIGAITLIFFTAIVKITGISINFISQILSVLTGLALSTDYSLFIISRFKEEMETNDSYVSVYKTLAYSGKTLFYSGLIMVCSVSALYLPDISITRAIVISMLLVIFLSMINSIVFLPVLVNLLQKHLDKPKYFSRLIDNRKKELFWENFTTHIVKYPKSYFLFSICFLFLLILPVFNIKLFSPVITIAPEGSESISGYNKLQEDGWGGQLVPINVIVKFDQKNSIYSKEAISYIYDLTKKIESNKKVASLQSLTSWNKDFSKQDYINFYSNVYMLTSVFQQNINPLINYNTGMNMSLINVYPKNLKDLSDSFDILAFLKKEEKTTSPQLRVGGIVSRVNEFTKELYSYTFEMLFIIFIGIYIIIFIHIKSLVIPIKAGIMNFLPITASFGILTLIFQYGFLHNILNTPINYAVTNIVPIILFCVIFGLSMDYEILILSRITEEYHKTGDVKKAIIKGLSKSGSLITGASFILAGVFLPGVFSSSPQIKEICIGMISAIILDSTIVRIIMVPSFMMLMGKWNWVGLKKVV